MKRKTTWIIALIAIPLVAAVFTLHAQTKDNGRDEQSERTRSLLADEQSRIESSEFDLRITVTDADGKPLDGVTMELELKRPKLPLLSGEWESQREKEKTVKSKIHIQEKGWTKIDLRFRKDGYHLEQRSFSINIMNEDKANLFVKRDLQVKMSKQMPIASLFGGGGMLSYNIENGKRDILDIDIFPKKAGKETTDLKKKEEMKSEEDEENEEDEDIEDEIIKDPHIISIDSKAKPETVKYMEIDFRRDKDGGIVYDTTDTKGVANPTSCIVRFCSDDPGDGLLFVSKVESPKSWEAEKELTTAPEKGYKKEIAIDLGEKNKKFCVFCYIKQGDHYGKARLGPVYIQEEKNKIQLVKMNVKVSFNTLEGDHNVRSY